MDPNTFPVAPGIQVESSTKMVLDLRWVVPGAVFSSKIRCHKISGGQNLAVADVCLGGEPRAVHLKKGVFFGDEKGI